MSLTAVGTSSQQIRKQKVRGARSRSTSKGLCLPVPPKVALPAKQCHHWEQLCKTWMGGAFQIQIITHEALYCGAHSLGQRCPNHGYSVIILLCHQGWGLLPSNTLSRDTTGHSQSHRNHCCFRGCITYYVCYHQNTQ